MPRVKVRYFAIFREQAGRDFEQLATTASSPSALFEELQVRYNFTLPKRAIRVAINNEFDSMDSVLSDGDEVAFIAPVAGG